MFLLPWASLVAQRVNRETRVQSLDREDPWEKEMATQSSILAGWTPRTEELKGYSPQGHKRAGYNWARYILPYRVIFGFRYFPFKIFFPAEDRLLLHKYFLAVLCNLRNWPHQGKHRILTTGSPRGRLQMFFLIYQHDVNNVALSKLYKHSQLGHVLNYNYFLCTTSSFSYGWW